MDFLRTTSVAEVYKFIKQFHFEPMYGENPFNRLTFSDATLVRLDGQSFELKLKADTDGYYSIDSDIWVRTWTANPLAVRKLLMLEVFPEIQPDNTSVGVRLYDGTQDLYWDGADWSTAGAGDWNDEATINAHIETFPILPDRKFAVVLNLVTTDHEVTPTVTEVRVLMEVHIDYMEDLIFRSLLPMMEAGIRPTGNFVLPAYTEDVDEIDFSESRKNTPYNIIDVERVYDFTDDPDLLYNLLDTYTPGTGIITLTSDLPTGHVPFVVFRYQPEVVFITHQDFYEVAKLPVLLLQEMDVPQVSSFGLAAREGVVDKGTGNAVVVNEPLKATIEFRLHGLTSLAVDEMRLLSNVQKFFDSTHFVRSVGLDEKYMMYLIKEFRDLSNPNRADQRAFWTRFVIQDVRMPYSSETAHAVEKVVATFSGPKPPHEDPVKGGARVIATAHREDGPREFEEEIEIT